MDEFEIDRSALVETFTAEARERLDEMECSLLSLETTPGDPEQLAALFRAGHSLKGAAASVGFLRIRDLAHDLEGTLERLRSRTVLVDPFLVAALLSVVDYLRRAVSAAAAGEEPSEVAAASFRRRLAEAEHGSRPRAG